MGKIKNQTQAQKEIHNRAVKIRKMTDEELVKRFDAVTKTACAAGVSAEQLNTNGIKEFLHDLDAADLRGIGKITIKKISEFAKEKGYI